MNHLTISIGRLFASSWRLTRPASLVLGGILLAGCDEPVDPNVRAVFPASGKILYRGKPIPDATVCLHPVTPFSDGKPAVVPRAEVNKNGEFTFTTYRTHDGAPVGEYCVTVSWLGPLEGIDEDAEDRLRELLPQKYVNARTTDLRFAVSDQASNELPEIQIR